MALRSQPLTSGEETCPGPEMTFAAIAQEMTARGYPMGEEYARRIARDALRKLSRLLSAEFEEELSCEN